jgi:hypothetical protein
VARSLLTGRLEHAAADASPDPFAPEAQAQQPAGGAGEELSAAPSAGPLVESESGSSVVLPGQSGSRGKKAKPPTYWQSAAQIGVQVGSALEYAHQQGVLHTAEAGELAPEDPVEGSEAPAGRPRRGKQVGHVEAPQPVHGTRPDSFGDPFGMAKLSVEEPDALMHARPGPWEPGR